MTDKDLIAFDKDTVRSKDVNGFLHVSKTPISKANICPYYGREIPNYESLRKTEASHGLKSLKPRKKN